MTVCCLASVDVQTAHLCTHYHITLDMIDEYYNDIINCMTKPAACTLTNNSSVSVYCDFVIPDCNDITTDKHKLARNALMSLVLIVQPRFEVKFEVM